MKKQIFILLLAAAICSGKANAATPAVDQHMQSPQAAEPADYAAGEYDKDPLEKYNRVAYKFNSVVDSYILAPVARGYRDVIPAWGRKRVTNALYNISEPITFVNSILQADPENSFTSLWRFLLNSTVGVAGIFDVADGFGLHPRQEDFGQTFAVWGWKNSTYIVIPFIGPSTLRDGIGLAGDYYANPFYNGMIIDNSYYIYGLVAVDVIDKRANLLPVTDDIEKNSLDPYATYRSAYLQHRENEIHNGKSTTNSNDYRF